MSDSARKTYEDFLAYFKIAVLHEYKVNTHKYEIKEEHNGGFIINRILDGTTQNRWYQIRYAYRKLKDGSNCVAAWKPDLAKISPEEKKVWIANELKNPQFSNRDPDFSDWVGVYLSPRGKFPVAKLRPIAKIYLQMRLINALTEEMLGRMLFRKENNPDLQYPQAENTKSYKAAIMQLHNLVNDEMDLETMRVLASRLSVKLTDDTKQLNSLKEILPEDKIKKIHEPLKICSNKRAKIHGVSKEGTKAYDAFAEFKKDLINIGDALSELKSWLEDVSDFDAARCLQRRELRALFPDLEETEYLEAMADEIRTSLGKTIANVEYGKEKSDPNCHEREGLIIHFEDGTSLSILVGSNAQNLAHEHEDLSPDDFHTDLNFFWAPSVRKK